MSAVVRARFSTSNCLRKRSARLVATPRRSPVSKSRFSPLWRKLFITRCKCNVRSYIPQGCGHPHPVSIGRRSCEGFAGALPSIELQDQWRRPIQLWLRYVRTLMGRRGPLYTSGGFRTAVWSGSSGVVNARHRFQLAALSGHRHSDRRGNRKPGGR